MNGRKRNNLILVNEATLLMVLLSDVKGLDKTQAIKAFRQKIESESTLECLNHDPFKAG
jgi:hypothetical protein